MNMHEIPNFVLETMPHAIGFHPAEIRRMALERAVVIGARRLPSFDRMLWIVDQQLERIERLNGRNNPEIIKPFENKRACLFLGEGCGTDDDPIPHIHDEAYGPQWSRSSGFLWHHSHTYGFNEEGLGLRDFIVFEK